MIKSLQAALSALVLLTIGSVANAAVINITDPDAAPVSSTIAGSGTASIVHYDGSDALRLTTNVDVNDKANVTVDGSFGNFGDLLNDSALNFEYRFQKADVAGGNIYAAPALSLFLYDENFAGDGFLEIKYEHYWGIGNAAVTTDTWITANIDFTQGPMWANDGLGLNNSSGGPPLFTLQNILDGTASSTVALTEDMVLDYSALFDADLVGIGLTVGTYNVNQEGYVDYVSMTTSAGTDVYNFSVVPIPAAAWLFGSALAGLGWLRRKQTV